MLSPEEMQERLKGVASLSLDGPPADFSASLNLYADDIDLDQLTELIGNQPTYSQRRGQLIGKRRQRPAPIGLWSLAAPRDLEFLAQLEYLLDATPSAPTIWQDLVQTHRIALSCTMALHTWTRGFELPCHILAEIGRRHWDFGLSVYGAEGGEVLEAFLSDQAGDHAQPAD